jgi:signal recognition particle subunit SRP19
MSRRTAIIEEFDDDTELPLPSHPLPNTGATGPLLEEIDIEYDKFPPSYNADPSPSQQPQSQARPPDINGPKANNTVTDVTPYKSCVLGAFASAP